MNHLASLLVFLAHVFLLKALELPESKRDLFPSKDGCGTQYCEAFPWLVFIPLESRINNPGADLRCAGVLISNRYVLTHMSCFQFVLTKVHIGRFSTNKNVTCEEKPVLEIDIEKRVVHEPSGIALLRLAEEVEFGHDVSPICLPFDDFKRAEAGAQVMTSGWGSTSYTGKRAQTMKKVIASVITNEECQKSGVIEDAGDQTALCVKENNNERDVPCYGDEGSPVMYFSERKWVAEGILFSLFDGEGKHCAIEKPARGSRITEDVLQYIVDQVHA